MEQVPFKGNPMFRLISSCLFCFHVHVPDCGLFCPNQSTATTWLWTLGAPPFGCCWCDWEVKRDTMLTCTTRSTVSHRRLCRAQGMKYEPLFHNWSSDKKDCDVRMKCIQFRRLTSVSFSPAAAIRPHCVLHRRLPWVHGHERSIHTYGIYLLLPLSPEQTGSGNAQFNILVIIALICTYWSIDIKFEETISVCFSASSLKTICLDDRTPFWRHFYSWFTHVAIVIGYWLQRPCTDLKRLKSFF